MNSTATWDPELKKQCQSNQFREEEKNAIAFLKGSSVLKKLKWCKQLHFRCTYVLRGITVTCPLPIQDVLMPSEVVVIKVKPIMIILCTKMIMIITIDPELIWSTAQSRTGCTHSALISLWCWWWAYLIFVILFTHSQFEANKILKWVNSRQNCVQNFTLCAPILPWYHCDDGHEEENEGREITRLTYNCAHLRSTKESLTFQYDIWWYWVSRRQYWLVLGGIGSV